MRNKHNEGYTLPLVMVVLLVLAIVAVTIMTTSMNNMLRQQEFIETMEDQYAAQGQIEELVGKLIYSKDGDIGGILAKDYGSDFAVSGSGVLTIMSKVGNVRIDCVITFEEVADENDVINPNKVTYTSYVISKGGGT